MQSFPRACCRGAGGGRTGGRVELSSFTHIKPTSFYHHHLLSLSTKNNDACFGEEPTAAAAATALLRIGVAV